MQSHIMRTDDTLRVNLLSVSVLFLKKTCKFCQMNFISLGHNYSCWTLAIIHSQWYTNVRRKNILLDSNFCAF